MAANSLVLVPCPLCGAQNGFLPLRITSTDVHIRKYGELYGARKRSEWKACGDCGFVHQNPRPALEALQSYYARGQYHPPELPDSRDRHIQFCRWYYTEKVEFALRASGISAGRVFEIGSGLGGALWLFQERGWTALGLEPDPAQANFSRQTMGLSGVRQGLVDASLRLDEKVDMVFSNHAFEHLADLHDVMLGVRRVLKPEGLVVTVVPTYYSNRSRLSKAWMNSSHYSLFTHHSLSQLLARHGFEEVRHTYRGWAKEIDDLWHVARFTDVRIDPTRHFQNPRAVQRYVNIWNPIRSLMYAPLYAGHARRVRIAGVLSALATLLRRSPSEFARKAAARCLRMLRRPGR
jgi:SAM-dependent methyltransferase